MFGSTNPFGQSSSSPFGSQSVFGQTNNNPFAPKPFGGTTPFGSQTGSSIFGGTSTGVFGATQSSSPLGSTPVFGASSPAFGSTTPTFGASSTPAFGSSSSSFGSTSIFGQKPAFGAFGSSTTQSSPFGSSFQQSQPAFGSNVFGSSTPFGAQSQPAFGTPSTPTFGSSSTPAFGATSTPAFGVSSTPAFGTTANPTFGSTGSPFGVSSSPVFGSTTPAFGTSTTPAFGATSTPAFGATTTPAFGSTTSQAFGTSSTPFSFGSAPAFGQSTSAFGSTPFNTTPSPFATQGSAFGASTSTPTFGTSAFAGQPRGSRVAPYQPTPEADSGTQTAGKLESISAMPVYKDKSHEEFRFEDYQSGDKGGPAPAAQSTGAINFGTSTFGTSSTSPFGQSSANLFSSTTSSSPFAPKPAFGSPGFGVSSTPAFSSSAFGASTTSNLFGSTTPPETDPTQGEEAVRNEEYGFRGSVCEDVDVGTNVVPQEPGLPADNISVGITEGILEVCSEVNPTDERIENQLENLNVDEDVEIPRTEAEMEMNEEALLELDENVALDLQFGDQDYELQGTNLSDSIFNEIEEVEPAVDPVILEECNRVKLWREWRMSSYDRLMSQGVNMKEEEEFALQWLETTDIPQATRLSYINEVYIQKLHKRMEKGKEVVQEGGKHVQAPTEEELERINQKEHEKGLKISLQELHKPLVESSHIAELVTEPIGNLNIASTAEIVTEINEEVEEEQLVDYGSSPEYEVEQRTDGEEEGRNVVVEPDVENENLKVAGGNEDEIQPTEKAVNENDDDDNDDGNDRPEEGGSSGALIVKIPMSSPFHFVTFPEEQLQRTERIPQFQVSDMLMSQINQMQDQILEKTLYAISQQREVIDMNNNTITTELRNLHSQQARNQSILDGHYKSIFLDVEEKMRRIARISDADRGFFELKMLEEREKYEEMLGAHEDHIAKLQSLVEELTNMVKNVMKGQAQMKDDVKLIPEIKSDQDEIKAVQRDIRKTQFENARILDYLYDAAKKGERS